jgi:glyoxylase-like metal-dependent hydrolase (beta-lactamase superfamily II)
MSSGATLLGASDLGGGIGQIRLPMTGNPLRYINGYVVEEADGLTLVDCGWKGDDVLAALHDGLRDLGHALSGVRRVLITHHHFDHYGLAATLLRAGVPELLMHRLDWERARAFAADQAGNDRRADAWLARNGFTPAPLEEHGFDGRWEVIAPTRLVEDGERVGRLQALFTPGHSPGHLCFADLHGDRMLTGDHVLDPITPHVGQWVESDRDPIGEYLGSLEKVRAQGARAALPAHGEPFEDLARRVAELVAHTEHRDRQVAEILAEGPASAGAVAARLPWTRRNRAFADLGQFHQQFAVAETLAHLRHLQAAGRVVREPGPDPIRYRRSSAGCA